MRISSVFFIPNYRRFEYFDFNVGVCHDVYNESRA